MSRRAHAVHLTAKPLIWFGWQGIAAVNLRARKGPDSPSTGTGWGHNLGLQAHLGGLDTP